MFYRFHTIISVFSINNIYKIEERKLTFGFQADGYRVENNYVVTHNLKEDELFIEYSFTPISDSASPNIAIVYPSSLKKIGNNAFHNLKSKGTFETKGNEMYEYYAVDDIHQVVSIFFTLKGLILSTESRELSLSLLLQKMDIIKMLVLKLLYAG